MARRRCQGTPAARLKGAPAQGACWAGHPTYLYMLHRLCVRLIVGRGLRVEESGRVSAGCQPGPAQKAGYQPLARHSAVRAPPLPAPGPPCCMPAFPVVPRPRPLPLPAHPQLRMPCWGMSGGTRVFVPWCCTRCTVSQGRPLAATLALAAAAPKLGRLPRRPHTQPYASAACCSCELRDFTTGVPPRARPLPPQAAAPTPRLYSQTRHRPYWPQRWPACPLARSSRLSAASAARSRCCACRA